MGYHSIHNLRYQRDHYVLIFLIRARQKPLPPASGYIQFHYKYVQTYLVHLGCPMEWLVRKIPVMGLVVGSNLPVTHIRLGFLAVLLLWFVLARNLVAVGPNLEEATLWVKYMLCIYIYIYKYVYIDMYMGSLKTWGCTSLAPFIHPVPTTTPGGINGSSTCLRDNCGATGTSDFSPMVSPNLHDPTAVFSDSFRTWINCSSYELRNWIPMNSHSF